RRRAQRRARRLRGAGVEGTVRRLPLVPEGPALVLLRQPQCQPAHDPGRRDGTDSRPRHRCLRRADAGGGGSGRQGRSGRASRGDPVEAVRRLTDGAGADVVIEAVGSSETYRQAFFARDLAGTLVQVGVPDPSMTVELPMIELFGRGGALKSSWYGDCLPTR